MSGGVIFDIDGVLADFIGGFMSLAYDRYGVPPYGTLLQKEWSEFGGLTSEQAEEIWRRITASDSFWSSLPALVTGTTFDRLRGLQKKTTVYFVTNRPGKTAHAQTREWLVRLGMCSPTVIVSKYKGEIAKAVRATACLEDKASNASCVAWMTEDRTKSYLLNRQYNQCPKGMLASSVLRVDSVDDFLDEVEHDL